MQRLFLILGSLIGIILPFQTLGQVFTIGVEKLDYLPYFTFQQPQYQGLAPELLDAFAKSRGYIFNYKPLPVFRLHHTFLAGKLDFKFPDNPHWQQKLKQGKKVNYSNPILRSIDGVMLIPEKKGKGLAPFKTLGTIRGFTPWAWLEIIQTGQVKTIKTSGYYSLINMALSQRIDGIYANIMVGNYQLRQINKNGTLIFDTSLPYSDEYYYLSSIKHPQVLKEFNQFMLENETLFKKLKHKYQFEEVLQ